MLQSSSIYDSEFYLNDIQIQLVDSFLDLGILFTCNLSFNKHIDKCTSKAFSMLGFLIRFSKEFQDPYTLKVLYCAYVRSHLEYASTIWDPYYNNASDRIEAVQKRFLNFALRRLPRDNNVPFYLLPSYRSRCLLISIEPLFIRRSVACAVFVRDVLSHRIDCSDILWLFPLVTPSRQLRLRRDNFTIRQDFHWTNYGRSEPIFNMLKYFNSIVEVFDFNLSRTIFKRCVTEFILNS